jgi:hypothetical protein
MNLIPTVCDVNSRNMLITDDENITVIIIGSDVSTIATAGFELDQYTRISAETNKHEQRKRFQMTVSIYHKSGRAATTLTFYDYTFGDLKDGYAVRKAKQQQIMTNIYQSLTQ